MTGNQIIPLHAAKSTENDWQENWLPTISFASSLLEYMGLHPLQYCKERRCQWSKKEQGDIVAFLQESTRGLHPLLNVGSFFVAITRQMLTNLLRVVLLCKYQANLI
jgi:hypothetical protein